MLLFGVINVLVSTSGNQVGESGRDRPASLGRSSGPRHSARLCCFSRGWCGRPRSWSRGRSIHRPAPASATRLRTRCGRGSARIALAALIGAVALASLAYRLLVDHGLQQTAALFVGIPALLAIVVVFAVSPRSATGVACKAVTVGLLVSLLFLGEGMLCVVMSAPLFYLIAVAIGT